MCLSLEKRDNLHYLEHKTTVHSAIRGERVASYDGALCHYTCVNPWYHQTISLDRFHWLRNSPTCRFSGQIVCDQCPCTRIRRPCQQHVAPTLDLAGRDGCMT